MSSENTPTAAAATNAVPSITLTQTNSHQTHQSQMHQPPPQLQHHHHQHHRQYQSQPPVNHLHQPVQTHQSQELASKRHFVKSSTIPPRNKSNTVIANIPRRPPPIASMPSTAIPSTSNTVNAVPQNVFLPIVVDFSNFTVNCVPTAAATANTAANGNGGKK